MKKIKYFPLFFLIFLTSCAEHYTVRKRVASAGGTLGQKHHNQEEQQPEYVFFTEEDSLEVVSAIQPDSLSFTFLPKIPEVSLKEGRTQKVIQVALSYLGTPYKYGGLTRSGMDCSGLLQQSFLEIGISLNRSARGISEQGEEIPIEQVAPGDLLFFRTKSRKTINHTGLVVEVQNGVKFVHASTSRGVIVSDLCEAYWKRAFAKAKRLPI